MRLSEWIGRRLSRLATWLIYGTRHKCPACGAYDSHAINCPVPRTDREWKDIAIQYYKAWERDTKEGRAREYSHAMRAGYWEGKFHIVRNENNKLRKQLYRRARSTTAPAQGGEE